MQGVSVCLYVQRIMNQPVYICMGASSPARPQGRARDDPAEMVLAL